MSEINVIKTVLMILSDKLFNVSQSATSYKWLFIQPGFLSLLKQLHLQRIQPHLQSNLQADHLHTV